MERPEKIIERILERTIPEPNTGCYLWIGATHYFGYGSIRYKNKTHNVHRLLFTLIKGEIPEKMVVMHICDTPSCCNINHLKLGSHKDNMIDMSLKGRWNNQNKLKKICINGHYFDEQNTGIYKNERYCKKCSYQNSKKSFLKNKSKYKDRILKYSENYREINREDIRLKKKLWRQKRKEQGFKVT